MQAICISTSETTRTLSRQPGELRVNFAIFTWGRPEERAMMRVVLGMSHSRLDGVWPGFTWEEIIDRAVNSSWFSSERLAKEGLYGLLHGEVLSRVDYNDGRRLIYPTQRFIDLLSSSSGA